jgi:hypothetical protein
MSADHDSLQGTEEPKFDKLEMSEQQIRRASLICALLIGGCAALGIVLLANSDQPHGELSFSDCESIAPTAKRLSCYDALARQHSAPPAKGAIAPQFQGDSSL